MKDPFPEWRHDTLPLALLVLVLGTHAWFSIVGWENRNLPGVEFRQAQTAISAYFIQRDGDFSLAYPTPVLGKPWSIPMEFPLYQWTTVVVSNLTGTQLTQSARGVSLICFYLTLPAVALFLRNLGLNRGQRALALAAILTCPLYIFYSRAFLIETMALMFSAWFGVAFTRTIKKHSWGWFAITSGCGAAAGAVKVTTLMLFLLPCAAWGLYLLIRSLRNHDSKEFWTVMRWGLGPTLIPGVATISWTRFADAVKADHLQGSVLTSGSMTQFNFGYGFFDVRFAPETWQSIAGIIDFGILATPTAILGIVAIILWGRRWRLMALASLLLFVSAPLIFPLLYAWHDYYFVANSLFLMLAIGLLLADLLARSRGHLIAPLALILLISSQAFTYQSGYYPTQAQRGANGPKIAFTLQELTQPHDVVIIVGDDWNSMIPYYARRKSLMIRRSYENDFVLIKESIRNLDHESVPVFVLMHEQVDNKALVALAEETLGVSRHHYFEEESARIYPTRNLLKELLPEDVLVASDASPLNHGYYSTSQLFADRLLDRTVLNEQTSQIFENVSPIPNRFYFQFGPGIVEYGAHRVLNAHTSSLLWFDLSAGHHRLNWSGGLMDGAWDRSEFISDGVTVTVSREDASSDDDILWQTYLNPREEKKDRGAQQWALEFELMSDATVKIEVGPGPAGNGSTDWFYFRHITFD